MLFSSRKSLPSAPVFIPSHILPLLLLLQIGRICWAKHWPCPLGPSPTCPGYPLLSCAPLSYSCPPPQCSSDAQCSPLRCKQPDGICEDYPQPKLPGTKCARHSDCGMEMLCVGGKCEEGGTRAGSYRSCTKSADCPPMEDCEQGVCLIRVDEGTTGRTTGGGARGRDGGLNVWSSGWCSSTGRCAREQECIPAGPSNRGQCFPRAFFNQRGQLIPPPPGHPNCRDANSPPGRPSLHCQVRKWLCEDGLYWHLMDEQCPRSCGRCEDVAYVEALVREGRVQTMRGWGKWAEDDEGEGEEEDGAKVMMERPRGWKNGEEEEEEGEEDEEDEKGGRRKNEEEDDEEEAMDRRREEEEEMKRRKKEEKEKKGKSKRRKSGRKNEEERDDDDEEEEEMERSRKNGGGCVDHWDSGECAELAHLCSNGAYRKQLARFCSRTCRYC